MSIYNRFMAPDRWHRSFFILIVSVITFFLFFSQRAYANEEENSAVIYTKNIYHKHTGNSESGGGCYSVRKTGTKTVEVPCDGTMVYYPAVDGTQCSKCKAGYPGDESYRDCYHTEKKTTTYTYYEMGCNKSTSTILATVSVGQNTSEWAKEITLTCTYETAGNIALAQAPYIWNGTATDQNTYTVTGNGDYTLQLNADGNANTANGKIVIPVRNIDTTAPIIASHTLEPESGWVKEGVVLALTDVQDLQPDNTLGCGLHENAYSYDNGVTWTADTSYMYEESGTYTVMVRDGLENASSYEVSFYHVDNLAPTIENIEYDDTPNVLSTTLTVSASDVQTDGSDGCGLHEMPYSFDGGNTWTDNPVYETDRNGTITVAVRDALENVVYREVSITNIDGCGPAVSYKMSPDTWTTRDVTLHLTAQDVNADGSEGIGLPDTWYSLDGGSTWDNKEELVFAENRGVSVVARDKYGNLTYLDISVNHIDKDSPWVSLEMEVIGDGEDKTVILHADGGDGGSGLHDQPFSWDNGGSYGNEKSKTVTENGIYEVIVRDKVGNREHKQIEVNVFEEPVEEIIPVIEVVEPIPEEETVSYEEEEEPEPETETEPIVIKAEPKAHKPAVKQVHAVVEEDTWDIMDTWAVIGASAAGMGLVGVIGFCYINSIAVYVEDEKESMRYLCRLWIHRKEERHEVRITEALLEKCVTTHFCLHPSLLFRMRHKGVILSVLFPGDICIAVPISKEMDFSLL